MESPTALRSPSVIRESLDAFLLGWLKNESGWVEVWQQWTRHTILGAGKALRPQLVFDFYQACSGNRNPRPTETVLRLGLALEFLHTFTLIHDDLPCMDDDDFRRGRPTLHRLENEAIAVLMGDALHSAAFQLLTTTALPADHVVWAVRNFGRRTGASGLIEGQRLDIEGASASFAEIKKLHELKTGELFALSCELGALAGSGLRSDHLDIANDWGKRFGFLFQIHDDLLDRSASRSLMGKTPGKDQRLGRKTIFDFMTENEMHSYCDRQFEEMRSLLISLPAPEALLSSLSRLQKKIKLALS